MLRTRNEDDLTYKVKKVPLYHTPNRDTKIFGGYGIYNAKTNQIDCNVSDTFELNDNETLIKRGKKALGGGKLLNAVYSNTIFYITLLSNTRSHVTDAITICNSYDGSRAITVNYALYLEEFDVIIRTPVNGAFADGDVHLSENKFKALHHFVHDLKNHKLTWMEVNEKLQSHKPDKMPKRYEPLAMSGKERVMTAHGPCLFVPFVALNYAVAYWQMSQFETPIKASQLLYSQFRNILYGVNQ